MSRFCHGHRPVVSTSSEKLRKVRMRTIAASTATLVRPGGDGADDVTGHEQLQAEQDGPAQLLAETPVDITLAPGEPDDAGHERDRCAGHDDHDPRGIDGHPDLLDHVVVNHLAPR